MWVLITAKRERYEPKNEQSAIPILETIGIDDKVGLTVVIKYESERINSR